MAASSVSSFCGSSGAALSRRAGVGGRRSSAAAAARRGGALGAVMRKEGIHPEWYPEAKVFCGGVEVMTVGGAKEQYNVDIYSGNHPFYQGQSTMLVTDEGRLNKFKKRFAGLEEFAEVSLAAASGPAATEEDDKGKKLNKGGGGKGAKKKR